MIASELREWIALFIMNLVSDGQGGAREMIPPGLVADLPAAVRTPTPRLIFESDRLADRVQYVFTIRYQPLVTTAWRVMWREQYLDIVGVKNLDQKDVWLELTCERRELGTQ
jgi:head-tail adaptor